MLGQAVAQDGSSELKSRLDEYSSQATIQYSKKRYDQAAELYAHATELQAEIHGEMAPQNADLLFLYGRCLYQVALTKSDVLGSKLAGEQRQDIIPNENDARSVAVKPEKSSSGIEAAQAPQDKATNTVQGSDLTPNESKPYFHFTGDENFDTSEEEESDGGVDESAEGNGQEEDDFAIAYEVLDLARILLIQSIESEHTEDANLQDVDNSHLRELRERLADTYDLQAEISMEGERFEEAVVDLKSALDCKKRLFSFESNVLAEAHYKLSLALEQASLLQPRDSNEAVEGGKQAVPTETSRVEAVQELEMAIASCKARVVAEENKLQSGSVEVDAERSKMIGQNIADVKEIVSDMQQKLQELHQTPISFDPTAVSDESKPLIGVLSTMLGASAEERKATLAKAAEGATDLTSLVKKTKTDQSHRKRDRSPQPSERPGKRRCEEEEPASDRRPKN